MKADEARRIQDGALSSNNLAVLKLLGIAFSRIREFASRGEDTVPHPFYSEGSGFASATPQIQLAAIVELRRLGYGCRHVPNPDPLDQRSSDYWEVSWKR